MSTQEVEQMQVADEEALHLFSNLASFNVNAEEVCIGFGIRDGRETNLVHMHTFMHLTVPHFLRFAETVNQQISLLVDRGVISREPEQ